MAYFLGIPANAPTPNTHTHPTSPHPIQTDHRHFDGWVSPFTKVSKIAVLRKHLIIEY